MSKRIRLTLCIEILSIEFDSDVLAIRVNGRNVEENKHVKLGGHHSLELELHRPFTLHKREWDIVALERIELATNPAKTADVACVLMEEGELFPRTPDPAILLM